MAAWCIAGNSPSIPVNGPIYYRVATCSTDRSPVPFGGIGGLIAERDWEGRVVWEYKDGTLHHDFSRMDNGNTLVLGWEQVPRDMVPAIQGGMLGTEFEGGMGSDYLREVDPDGNALWEWHAYEALDVHQNIICPFENRTVWTHTNACTVLPDGNILTSFRKRNTIAIIDRRTGKFVWKYRDIELGHQHDPTMLENGNILVFANGMHIPRNPRSQVLEIDPRRNEVVWQYGTRPGWEFFSSFISGAQRLSNGNTLICEGTTGHLFEVTVDGEIVWEYVTCPQ
jgi:outer membrane protein assembly factor BamB